MSKSARLRAEDVRALIHLVGECRDLGDDPVAWREHFSRRLAGLTGAGLGQLGEAVDVVGKLRAIRACFWGWQNGFDPAVLSQALAEHGTDLKFSPIFRAYFDLPPGGLGACVSRTDVVPDREWDRSTYREVIHSPLGCGHHLLCALPLPGGGGEVHAVTLSRPRAERRDFSSRDRGLVREAVAAVVPLIGGPLAGFGEPSPADLPPRCRAVLRCLLDGDPDKHVAARLGLTRHTVNQYAKQIYRHFGVRSRSELLARWVRRRWGVRGRWVEGAGVESVPSERGPQLEGPSAIG